jgi:glycerol-3-phosphate dehydrogenase
MWPFQYWRTRAGVGIGDVVYEPDVHRDVEQLTARRYDLLVVGGGIHGLFAAYDAAARGLTVALIDRGDYGSGLTFNHQRTLHGGLRSLQRGRVLACRRELAERRTWAHIAPHYLRPLPFLIGTYRFSRRSRWLLKAGFALYDRLGRQRNKGVPPELHLPRPKLESAAATRRLFPGVSEPGLSGGAVWYDYQTRHPDRLTWTIALAAMQAGAQLVNHAEALAPLHADGRVAGARVVDRLSGRTVDVHAAVTLLAAGSGLRTLLPAFGGGAAPPFLRAMNVLLNRPARDIALVAAGPRGRMLTAVPWAGYVLVGTHQSPVAVADDQGPTPALLDGCLADVNATFPRLSAKPEDVRILHYGLVPAMQRGAGADLLGTPVVTRHSKTGAPGLVSLVGVKYTSARRAAARAVNAVFEDLGRPRVRGRTSARPLPHAAVADVEGRLVEAMRALGVTLDRDVVEHLVGWYGTEAPDVVRHGVAHRLLERLDPSTPVLAAEIDYAGATAQAMRLADAVLRRTPLGSAGHPGDTALQRAADVLGRRHGWTPERTVEEMADVAAAYPPK